MEEMSRSFRPLPNLPPSQPSVEDGADSPKIDLESPENKVMNLFTTVTQNLPRLDQPPTLSLPSNITYHEGPPESEIEESVNDTFLSTFDLDHAESLEGEEFEFLSVEDDDSDDWNFTDEDMEEGLALGRAGEAVANQAREAARSGSAERTGYRPLPLTSEELDAEFQKLYADVEGGEYDVGGQYYEPNIAEAPRQDQAEEAIREASLPPLPRPILPNDESAGHEAIPPNQREGLAQDVQPAGHEAIPPNQRNQRGAVQNHQPIHQHLDGLKQNIERALNDNQPQAFAQLMNEASNTAANIQGTPAAESEEIKAVLDEIKELDSQFQKNIQDSVNQLKIEISKSRTTINWLQEKKIRKPGRLKMHQERLKTLEKQLSKVSSAHTSILEDQNKIKALKNRKSKMKERLEATSKRQFIQRFQIKRNIQSINREIKTIKKSVAKIAIRSGYPTNTVGVRFAKLLDLKAKIEQKGNENITENERESYEETIGELARIVNLLAANQNENAETIEELETYLDEKKEYLDHILSNPSAGTKETREILEREIGFLENTGLFDF